MNQLSIDQIRPNPDQPRKYFEEESLEGLAKSIQKEGILAPLLVRPIDGGYQIVHGERRWRAAKMAGLEEVPCIVRETDDAGAFRVSLVENIARSDLNPVEEASAFERLVNTGMTQEEVGRLIGKSQGYVAQRLALLRLPEEIQDKIITRVITPTAGRALLGVNDPDEQIRLADQAAEGLLTTRQLEALSKEPDDEIMIPWAPGEYEWITKIKDRGGNPLPVIFYLLRDRLMPSQKEKVFANMPEDFPWIGMAIYTEFNRVCPGVRVSNLGMEFPEDTTFEEYKAVGDLLEQFPLEGI